MKKYLFSSRTIRAIAVAGAVAAVAVPASSASADVSGSSTLFVTAQGTSLLGQELPVLGTQGYDITLPVNVGVVPGESLVADALDFTVAANVELGGVELVNLYGDPKMAH